MYPKTLKTLLLTLFLIGCSIFSFANDHYRVNTERLNVRSTIGASSIPFGYVQYGDTVDVVDKTNSYWYKIKIQDKEGYVRSKYLLQINNESDIGTNSGVSTKDKVIGAALLIFVVLCVIGLVVLNNKKPKYDSSQNPQYNPSLLGTSIIIKNKSVGLAILLTLLFGPFGMFYSTVRGALIMIFLPILIIVVLVCLANTNSIMFDLALAGSILYAIFYWLICIIWAAVSASNSNKIIINQSQPALYEK